MPLSKIRVSLNFYLCQILEDRLNLSIFPLYLAYAFLFLFMLFVISVTNSRHIVNFIALIIKMLDGSDLWIIYPYL